MNDEEHDKARPAHLPQPTYWPFFLALGTVFIFWGILTTWLITGIGVVVFAVALGGWIADIHHELQNDNSDEL